MPTPAASTTDFEGLTTRYTGPVAQQYDARRAGTAKWQKEQDLVERILSQFPPGSSVVDIPVGTGRFLPVYRQLGITATGLDVSADMLARARERCGNAALRLSDIRRIDASDGEYDAAVCVRFLNWVDAAALTAAIGELARVSRHHVVLSVRCHVPIPRTSLDRRFRQQWARRRQPQQGQLIVHDSRVVQEACRRAGLHAVSKERVEASPNGSEYCIYHLAKAVS